MRTTILLLVLLPLGLLAQTYEVTGTVKDGQGAAVAFANVFILKASDSSIVQGTSAREDGRFVLTNVLPDLYLLKASYFGSGSKMRALDISRDVNIGTIILDNNGSDLDEVIVTARQPTLEQKADRLVFHVENTIVSQGNTWDLIRNTPGVVNVQGSLQIRGQEATVYLNDRKIQLSPTEVQDLLEGLSGSSIASVELIQNPPARYDSEGGPILNIVTSRAVTPGYKGSLQGSFTQGVFPKYQVGSSHYFKNDKLNLFTNYSISPRKEFDDVPSTINFINTSDDIFARWESQLDRVTDKLTHNANLTADYDFDKRNSINLTSNFSYTPEDRVNNRLVMEALDASQNLDSTLVTTSLIDNQTLNLATDLTYEHRFDKAGRVVKVNGHFTRYDDTQDQDGSTDYFDPSGMFTRNFTFQTDAGQDIKIYTGQLDYFDLLGEVNFEAGFKQSVIRSSSRIDYLAVNGSQSNFPDASTDNYEYSEDISAGYVSFLRNWEKWSVKAGLRAEQTRAEGNSITLSETIIQDYFELFPSFYLMRNLGEENSMSFNYSRKLRRPNYRDLNPFRYYFNEYDFASGNPNLRPSFSHNFNLNLSLKNTYFIDLYYRDNGKYVMDLSFQDNQRQILRQERQNGLGSISYGLDLIVNESITNAWYLFAYGSLFVEEEKFLGVESGNVPITNRVEGVFLQVGNFFTLSGDGTFTGEASFTYLSSFLTGSYIQDATATLNLGVKKTFWDNRASVSVAFEDILNRSNALRTTRYLNQFNSYTKNEETQILRVGFTYNFGNFRLTDNQRDVNKTERDRL
ncbi:outer membrane beta-barrel family protein [Zeaxanthinibacter enoshimensis]|nr:outer membrane beta-barrel family protein [Zeaxanthinibacter enoshimensis]